MKKILGLATAAAVTVSACNSKLDLTQSNVFKDKQAKLDYVNANLNLADDKDAVVRILSKVKDNVYMTTGAVENSKTIKLSSSKLSTPLKEKTELAQESDTNVSKRVDALRYPTELDSKCLEGAAKDALQKAMKEPLADAFANNTDAAVAINGKQMHKYIDGVEYAATIKDCVLGEFTKVANNDQFFTSS